VCAQIFLCRIHFLIQCVSNNWCECTYILFSWARFWSKCVKVYILYSSHIRFQWCVSLSTSSERVHPKINHLLAIFSFFFDSMWWADNPIPIAITNWVGVDSTITIVRLQLRNHQVIIFSQILHSPIFIFLIFIFFFVHKNIYIYYFIYYKKKHLHRVLI